MALPTIMLLLLHFSARAARLKTGMSASANSETDSATSDASVFKLSKTGDDCSGLVVYRGRSVNCKVLKRLGGGQQANTNIVSIDGLKCVMKETSDPSTVGNLKWERTVIQELQTAGFTDMPLYDLDFTAKEQRNSAVLVMEFLDGWFDLNHAAPPETAAVREVRAAAFFLALNNMYNCKKSHCDLNPGNAMFSAEDPSLCKIIDFGMAARNQGLPGTCLAFNAIPDLGYDGAAWNQIYLKLGAPKGAGSIFHACGGTRCNSQQKWTDIVQTSAKVMSAYQTEANHSMKPLDLDRVAEDVYTEPSMADLRQQPPKRNYGYTEGVVQSQVRPTMARGGEPRPEKIKGEGFNGYSEERSQEKMQPTKARGGPSIPSMVAIKTKELAEEVKDGTIVEYQGVMGKAIFPKIKPPRLYFNFQPLDGQKQTPVTILWASAQNDLRANI